MAYGRRTRKRRMSSRRGRKSYGRKRGGAFRQARSKSRYYEVSRGGIRL